MHASVHSCTLIFRSKCVVAVGAAHTHTHSLSLSLHRISSYYIFVRVASVVFACRYPIIDSKCHTAPKACICSSVRSRRCGGCEEDVSGIGLCSTSSYMACIWLKPHWPGDACTKAGTPQTCSVPTLAE